MSKEDSVLEGTAIDPVCGMSVEIDRAIYTAEHEGAEHYFCSLRCQDKSSVSVIGNALRLRGVKLPIFAGQRARGS